MIDEYEERRKYINDNILIKLSQIGYALYCDYAICDRYHLTNDVFNISCIEKLKTNDKLYINASIDNIDNHIDNLIIILNKNNVKLNFYILYEPCVRVEIIDKLYPYTINMYLQNNLYDREKIHCMPIGIRDGEEVFPPHKGFTQKDIVDELKIIREKKYLCLLCFTSGNNLDRYNCEKTLENKNFITNLNKDFNHLEINNNIGKVPININYKYIHESYYILSPIGCGFATHRFYEAIYLNSIPIVKKTNTVFDKLYNIIPCLVVNDWHEVTEELLEKNKEKLINLLYEFKSKYNIFDDLNSIEELLLLT